MAGEQAVGPTPEQIIQNAAAHYLTVSHAPGCCIAVYDQDSFGDSGLVYPHGLVGVPGSGTPVVGVTADTVFEIGSVTKVFTSTLLGLVVQAGGAWLTDTVQSWLDRNGKIVSTDLEGITLGQLATHTSGMPDQPKGLTDYSKPLFADQPPTKPIIEWWDAYATPPPGCWQYSNIGFVTLGFAVTQMFPLPGWQYDAILSEQVTGPLGLSRTGANVDPTWLAARGAIGRWSSENGRFVFHGNVPTNDSAFDLKSTGNDMLAFLKAQIDPPDDLLGRAIALTQQRQGTFPICSTGAADQSGTVTMGLGWQITTDTSGNAVFAKNGATSRGGFEAVVIFVPALRCGVAVLSNQYFDASAPHPPGIAPGATALLIIQKLHPGFALAEPLPDRSVSD